MPLSRSSPMRLEDIAAGSALTGLDPATVCTVAAVVPVADGCITVVYRTPDGALRERLLHRTDETRLAIATAERPWSFDGDGDAFKLAVEARRMDLAFLFDPMMAVHTSNVEPLPHQITAVYESMLPRQPLRFVLARHAPLELIGSNVEPEPIAILKNRSVAAFCGIGNPGGFLRTITPLCAKVIGFREFPDHHAYSEADIVFVRGQATHLAADVLVTTEKDWVKLAHLDSARTGTPEILRLDIEAKFTSADESALLERVIRVIRRTPGQA